MMGLEHAILNQMPWYHKLWFIPGVLIGLIVLTLWEFIKSKLNVIRGGV